MNYNEFAKAFREQIKSYLPAEFKEAEVQTINVKKNNDVEKEGVSMNYSPGISVVFYPEDLYIPYQYGIPFEEIMQKAARGFLDSIISEEHCPQCAPAPSPAWRKRRSDAPRWEHRTSP